LSGTSDAVKATAKVVFAVSFGGPLAGLREGGVQLTDLLDRYGRRSKPVYEQVLHRIEAELGSVAAELHADTGSVERALGTARELFELYALSPDDLATLGFDPRRAADELLANRGRSLLRGAQLGEPAGHLCRQVVQACYRAILADPALLPGRSGAFQRRMLDDLDDVRGELTNLPGQIRDALLPLLVGSHIGAAGGSGAAGSIGQLGTATVRGGAAGLARSAYRQQVRRIAPPVLLDRDVELADLAGFCAAPDPGGSYAWWRAPAWAGKSALMSWFVLHPPDLVDVVAFFITARLASQDDRVAFTDVVLEQLAALLGQDLPPSLTEATREGHLLSLLEQAAAASREQGRRLVLLVDGLDEDRGVTAGPDAHSIAALLPAAPAAGMRVIVAGRLNPPVPADVPSWHPLRDPVIVRQLAPSPHAAGIRHDAEQALERLLDGTPVEKEVLGLLVAALGGLSVHDFAELIDSPEVTEYAIRRLLQSVSGRTFTPRFSAWQPGTGPDVYVLGHEDLQTAAVEMLGEKRLALYRDRLHAWADTYRGHGWPANTPEYLLRGYQRMLHATRDRARLVACGLDTACHERMLDLSGGDTDALREISDAYAAILAQDDPDLTAALRLARHRDQLTSRNQHIPSNLPAVWAVLGKHTRAQALALAITDPHRQAEVLTSLVTALAAAGQPERATRLAADAEAAARVITDPDRQAEALTELVTALAAAGQP